MGFCYFLWEQHLDLTREDLARAEYILLQSPTSACTCPPGATSLLERVSWKGLEMGRRPYSAQSSSYGAAASKKTFLCFGDTDAGTGKRSPSLRPSQAGPRPMACGRPAAPGRRRGGSVSQRREREAENTDAPGPAVEPSRAADGLAGVRAARRHEPLAGLLLKVLHVLDPDRKLEDTWAYCEDTGKSAEEPRKLFTKRCTGVPSGRPKETPVSHSGQWPCEEKASEMDLLRDNGPLLQDNARKGVSDFCSWLAAVGHLNIDEEFILKQFDVDIRNRLSRDVLRVMRPNQVPLELRCRVGLSKLQEPGFFQELDQKRKPHKAQNPHRPKWVKMRYGAWYLNTKLWRKQRADEPLVDPKVLRQAQDESSRRKLRAQEERLADFHATAAFRDFILSRGHRMPSFLENIYAGKKGKCACRTPTKPTQG
nr:protein FAM47E isoform X1 [Oryctolagus cuniculus]XP_051675630.1 protein FAM47E isoform X1 [Oryctolagus cuniculus]